MGPPADQVEHRGCGKVAGGRHSDIPAGKGELPHHMGTHYIDGLNATALRAPLDRLLHTPTGSRPWCISQSWGILFSRMFVEFRRPQFIAHFVLRCKVYVFISQTAVLLGSATAHASSTIMPNNSSRLNTRLRSSYRLPSFSTYKEHQPYTCQINQPTFSQTFMPRNAAVLKSWLAKKIEQAGDPEANSSSWHSVIRDFQRLIEDTPEIYKGFHEMFTQIPPDHEDDPTGQPQVENYMSMLNLFDVIISEAPAWHYDPENPTANNLVGFPINAVLDWPMGTDAGYAMFINPAVNAQLKKMFDVWSTYLTSYASTEVLSDSDNGWFSPSAMEQLPDFASTYVCDPDDPSGHYGFTSWDHFFTRLFQPGQREIDPELVDNDAIVHSACESTVYRVAYDVQPRDRFWIKGQPYSVIHMLNNDPYAPAFVGGAIFQAFLSATKYHRWHSPVTGVIVKTVQVPGTYYAESPTESFDDERGADPAGPNLSQSFITSVAARCLIFIRAKDPRIGLMCFVAVGMAEVSTCQTTVKEGDTVVKGQEIGMFHFGGSTHCLLFRPETNIQIDDQYIPKSDTGSPEVHVKAAIAWVGDKPYN